MKNNRYSAIINNKSLCLLVIILYIKNPVYSQKISFDTLNLKKYNSNLYLPRDTNIKHNILFGNTAFLRLSMRNDSLSCTLSCKPFEEYNLTDENGKPIADFNEMLSHIVKKYSTTVSRIYRYDLQCYVADSMATFELYDNQGHLLPISAFIIRKYDRYLIMCFCTNYVRNATKEELESFFRYVREIRLKAND